MRVPDILALEKLVDLRLSERRIGAEVQIDDALAVADDHRLQHQSPVIGTVDVPCSQQATLQVAELVEHEQRMVTGAAEVAIIG